MVTPQIIEIDGIQRCAPAGFGAELSVSTAHASEAGRLEGVHYLLDCPTTHLRQTMRIDMLGADRSQVRIDMDLLDLVPGFTLLVHFMTG